MDIDTEGRAGPDPDRTLTDALETARLVLDVPGPPDVAELYRLVGGSDREAICAHLVWEGPDDEADIAAWVDKCRTLPFEPFGFHWVLRDRTGEIAGTAGAPLGSVGTRPRGIPGRADIGYWLGRPYWGRGLMAEALAAVVAYDFEELAMAKVEADVFLGNDRGTRLVEKLGFRREGHIRRAVQKRGRWVDEYLYGIVPGELVAPS